MNVCYLSIYFSAELFCFDSVYNERRVRVLLFFFHSFDLYPILIMLTWRFWSSDECRQRVHLIITKKIMEMHFLCSHFNVLRFDSSAQSEFYQTKNVVNRQLSDWVAGQNYPWKLNTKNENCLSNWCNISTGCMGNQLFANVW